MKTRLPVVTFFILISALFLQACGDGIYKPSSRGKLSEVVVVMDSLHWNGELADAIRATFGAEIQTMPRSEPQYDLVFRDIRSNSQLEQVKLARNVIFAAPLDEQTNVGTFVNAILGEDVKRRVSDGQNFAFPLRDRWANNQWALVLTAPDREALLERIRYGSDPLVANLNLVERERWTQDVYERNENVTLSDSVRKQHGWSIRVQHDYELSVDTTNFVSFARLLPENYRYVWVFWDDNVTDVNGIDSRWIDARRDTLLKNWVEGTRENSYVVTDYRRPITTDTIDFKGYYAFQTKGIWMMNTQTMGGSFIQYTVFVPEQRRLYYLICSIFAPTVGHRYFLNQFEAIVWTFEPDLKSTPQPSAGH